MSRIESLYLLPYLFSLVLSLGIAIYAWRHRQVQGAKAYAILASTQAVTVAGFLLELLNPDIAGKLIWDKVQWIALAAEAIAILGFAIQYTNYHFSKPRVAWSIISFIPVTFSMLVIADPWLHFIYPNPTLNNAIVFGELQYDFTWPVYAFAAFGFAATLSACILLARGVVRPYRHYRAQVTAVIIGLLIPIIGTTLPLLGIHITSLRDSTPITGALGNIIIAWGIFRYRWLNIIHIARDKILENMDDLVFVLDAEDHIIDINPSAVQLLNLNPAHVIGSPAEPIFSEWPEVVEEFRNPTNTNVEVIVKRDDRYYHFDVKSTLLNDRRGDYQGRVFVARDITPYAALQWELKELNEDLEQRVLQRTKELEDAYDTTLVGWARALEMRDKETKDHSQRVIDLTIKLAREMGIRGDNLTQLRRGAVLHDIGKMAIPDHILGKRGKLTAAERKVVELHPAYGYEFLSHIPFLERALDIPYCHHERWDGGGYPRGLKGEEIPLAARIFSVVDVWDAIRSDRPYNRAWSKKEAIRYLKEQSGSMFDPECVRIFLDLVKQGKI